MIPNLRVDGVSRVQAVCLQPFISRWREMADLHYARIESLVRQEGTEAVQRQLPVGQRYLPHVSSFGIGAVYGPDGSHQIIHALGTNSVRDLIEQELGGAVVCDLDQAWVRRQYPAHRRPKGHMPHFWHQDGALLYPFDPTGASAPAPDGLLKMVTCWLALTPCGQNAPGLELVRQRLDTLSAPASLTDDQIRTRFPADSFWKPVLEAGDLLLFSGGTLHRTHVDACMGEDRTSIELRFFPAQAIPGRLVSDRFLSFSPVDTEAT